MPVLRFMGRVKQCRIFPKLSRAFRFDPAQGFTRRFSHIFVRMPQARRKHQPRKASNMQKRPITTRGIVAHNVSSARTIPIMSRMEPVMPRAMRPWKLMFRLKNPAIREAKTSSDATQ